MSSHDRNKHQNINLPVSSFVSVYSCPCAILDTIMVFVIRELHEVLKSVTHDTNCRVIILKIRRRYQEARLLLL